MECFDFFTLRIFDTSSFANNTISKYNSRDILTTKWIYHSADFIDNGINSFFIERVEELLIKITNLAVNEQIEKNLNFIGLEKIHS